MAQNVLFTHYPLNVIPVKVMLCSYSLSLVKSGIKTCGLVLWQMVGFAVTANICTCQSLWHYTFSGTAAALAT